MGYARRNPSKKAARQIATPIRSSRPSASPSGTALNLRPIARPRTNPNRLLRPSVHLPGSRLTQNPSLPGPSSRCRTNPIAFFQEEIQEAQSDVEVPARGRQISLGLEVLRKTDCRRVGDHLEISFRGAVVVLVLSSIRRNVVLRVRHPASRITHSISPKPSSWLDVGQQSKMSTRPWSRRNPGWRCSTTGSRSCISIAGVSYPGP